eukprot:99502_1
MAHFFTRFVRRLIRPRLNQHSPRDEQMADNEKAMQSKNKKPKKKKKKKKNTKKAEKPSKEKVLVTNMGTKSMDFYFKRGDVDKDVYQKQLQDMRIRKKDEKQMCGDQKKKQTSTTHYKKRIMNHYNTKKRAIEHSESLDKWMTPQPAKRRRIDKEGDKKKKQNDKEEASP